MFRLGHKGFQITFENGYTVFVQWGEGNYVEDYPQLSRPGGRVKDELPLSPNAEVWAWHEKTKLEHGQPKGWNSPAEVLAYINEVAALGDLST